MIHFLFSNDEYTLLQSFLQNHKSKQNSIILFVSQLPIYHKLVNPIAIGRKKTKFWITSIFEIIHYSLAKR